MSIARPDAALMQRLGEDFFMELSDAEAETFAELIENNLKIYEVFDQLPDDLPPFKYPRTPGQRPEAPDNPLNAWYWQTDIAGAASGPLAGKRVVFKDNIMVAGVPMLTYC
jgi:amidase